MFLEAKPDLKEEIYQKIVAINQNIGNYDNGHKCFDELKTLTSQMLSLSYQDKRIISHAFILE